MEEVGAEPVDVLGLVAQHLAGEVLQGALQTGRDRDPVEQRPRAQQQAGPAPPLGRRHQTSLCPVNIEREIKGVRY